MVHFPQQPPPSQSFSAESWCRIFQLAGPLALQDLLVFLQGAITIGFVGRLDPRSLSAMILCSTPFNITGMSLVMGVASGALVPST